MAPHTRNLVMALTLSAASAVKNVEEKAEQCANISRVDQKEEDFLGPAPTWPKGPELTFEWLPLRTRVSFDSPCEDRGCVVVGEGEEAAAFSMSPFATVTRPELLPRSADGQLAVMFAYAKFGTDKDGKATKLQTGAFIYLDAKLEPIQEIRHMSFHIFGAMRFEDPVEVLEWRSKEGRTSKSESLIIHDGTIRKLHNQKYWFPITVSALSERGIGYYTWVAIGERIATANGAVAHAGGFMYAAARQKRGREGLPKPQFYAMKPSDGSCLEGIVGADNRFVGVMARATPEEREVMGTRYATRYDHWLATTTHASRMRDGWAMDSKSVLFVIDMQNDFVWGTFGQPCVAKRNELVANVVRLIHKAAEVGATIIVSIDYHSQDHCSFQAVHGFDPSKACKNDLILEENRSDTANGKAVADRYKNNAFPAHTWWEAHADFSRPSHGALLVTPVREALALAKSKGATVHRVFKGFTQHKDSFSAVPHSPPGSSQKPEPGTGGYAFKGEEASICYDYVDVTPGVEQSCFPTLGMMRNPDAEMKGVDTLLAETHSRVGGLNQIVVVGLVHDFCVKETAIYAKRWAEQTIGDAVSVNVHVDYSRPALEGLGLGPPMEMVPGVEFPPDTLGTAAHMDNTAAHFVQHKVGYIKGPPSDVGGMATTPQRTAAERQEARRARLHA